MQGEACCCLGVSLSGALRRGDGTSNPTGNVRNRDQSSRCLGGWLLHTCTVLRSMVYKPHKKNPDGLCLVLCASIASVGFFGTNSTLHIHCMPRRTTPRGISALCTYNRMCISTLTMLLSTFSVGFSFLQTWCMESPHGPSNCHSA